MISIQLYQPNAVNIDVMFPQSWNELTAAQLEIISAILLNEGNDINIAKAELLIRLLDNAAKGKVDLTLLDTEDCAINGLQLIDFIWRANALYKQPYPILAVDTFKVNGPSDYFDSLQVGEYEDCFMHYMNFKQDNDLLHIAKLTAILYRAKNVPYITYNAKQDVNVIYPYEKYVPYFNKIAKVQLYVISMWFAGCQALLQQIFPNVYSGGKNTSNEPDLLSFTKCIHAAAGAKNGTRDQIRRNNLKELLFDMEQESIKAKEMEDLYAAK